MAEIKSLIRKLEIGFYRTRKGKPPLKNAEGKPPLKNVEGKPKKNIIQEELQKYIQ